jgi:hypothetical protein
VQHQGDRSGLVDLCQAPKIQRRQLRVLAVRVADGDRQRIHAGFPHVAACLGGLGEFRGGLPFGGNRVGAAHVSEFAFHRHPVGMRQRHHLA